MTRLLQRAALAAALLLTSAPASAHEVLHTIERGRAVAVKAFFADGEVLAYTEYTVFSPVDAKIPYQKGRTDRAGYLAFVPDVPGTWHVRITDPNGHGLDLDVAADATSQAPPKTTGQIASWAFVLRPLLGAMVIVVLFGVLLFLYRKRGAGK